MNSLLLAAVLLVEQGRPVATIVAPADGPAAFAAGEVQRWVCDISGALLPIAQEAKPPRIIFRVSPGAVRDDGFRLSARDGDVVIEASQSRACVYGAYSLLEQLGCRFYGPGPVSVVMPKQADLSLPASLNLKREPTFRSRLVSGSSLIPEAFPTGGTPVEHVQWGLSHTRATADEAELDRLNRLGLLQYRFVHLWPELLIKQFFADGRPPEPANFTGREDWLPDDGTGKRRANKKCLCFSNPDALAWFTDNAANCILTDYRAAELISLWPPDGASILLCRCAKCAARAMNPTDWYLLTQNLIRQRLTEKGWRGRFGWIAYHGTEETPGKIELFDRGAGMDFLYGPRPRGGTLHGPFTADHPLNIKYRDNLKSWQDYLAAQRYAGTRTVFEYYYDLRLMLMSATGRAFLVPKHDVLQEDMRFYRAQGFDGFFDCCPPFAAFWPDPLNRWLYHRLLWDLNLDVAAARRDFFAHYYGAAAEPARAVREEMEKLMFEPPTEAVVAAIRKAALRVDPQATNDPMSRIRLQALRLWVDYCSLCKESECHEQPAGDAQRGLAAENAIQELLQKHQTFLVENRFMTARDVDCLAKEIPDRHRARWRSPKTKTDNKRATFTIAENGQARCVIYHPADAPLTVKEAAIELRRVLKKATGADLPIVKEPRSPMIGMGTTDAGIPEEGFRIETRNGNLFIVGHDSTDGASNGTWFGAMEFLERFVGVRWLLPGDAGEDVPEHRTLRIPATTLRGAPDFAYRSLPYLNHSQQVVPEWAKRMRVTTQGMSRPNCALTLNHSHFWESAFDAATLAAHPEFLALIKGVRRQPSKSDARTFKLCTTNPELVRAFAGRVCAVIEKNPQKRHFSLSPSDGDGWCECAKCRALDEPCDWTGSKQYGGVSLTRRILTFYNAVARLVREKHPDKQLCGYIYARYTYPPNEPIAVEPNVTLVLAPRAYYGCTLYRGELQQEFHKLIAAWSACAPGRLAYYDLPTKLIGHAGYSCAPLPVGVPILKTIFPTLKKHNVLGAYYYGIESWGTAGAHNYIVAKLLWNAGANVDALFDEWFDRAYGPAAATPMKQLYRQLDDKLAAYKRATGDFQWRFTPEMVLGVQAPLFDEMESLYAEALSKTATPAQRKRLEMFGDNMIVFHYHLRKVGKLATPERSRFYRNDDDFRTFAEVNRGSLALLQSQKAGTPSIEEFLRPKLIPKSSGKRPTETDGR
ncbi:MAG: DUF4838 domain-containing protein [Verrucomicrobia bacterium]|nr:DUF4838 domain-containing protein [Verrucomicrobiota bacterium]